MKISLLSQVKFGNYFDNAKTKSVFVGFDLQNSSVVKDDSFTKSSDTINLALEKLGELKFSQADIEKVSRYGANPVFKTGKEALEFAKSNNIPIIFGKVDQPDIHAQWINDKKTIIINEAYRFNKEPATICAISAAILHELGHAKDNDSLSSIQEEIDCLSMNALAFNEFKKQNPKMAQNLDLPIIQDGVELYMDLFMGNNKKALSERIKLKYGNLPIESPHHKANDFAKSVVQ